MTAKKRKPRKSPPTQRQVPWKLRGGGEIRFAGPAQEAFHGSEAMWMWDAKLGCFLGARSQGPSKG